MAFSLQARVVFPVDRPPIEHGVVTIEGEQVVSVGTKAEARDLTDLGAVALLPGLVNCHTHLEFSHLQRPLGEPGMALVDWIRLVLAERGRAGSNSFNSIEAGLAECIRHGVTTLGDIATGRTDNPVRLGQRDGQDCPSYKSLDITRFIEVIGFSRARAASAFSAIGEQLKAIAVHWNARFGISPHAPYTVSPDLLRKLIKLAREGGLPVAMHIAESAEELKLLETGTGPFQQLLDERSMWDASAIPLGSRPLDYLRLLAEAPRALVIHGNYLDEEEQSFLAVNADRISLVYCPRTHSCFRHPPYPLPQLLAAGVRVALGTDSRASNPDLDLLAEMRHVAREFPMIDPRVILHMGTLSGAEALGRAGDVGSIAPGKLANLVAVLLSDDSCGPTDELLRGLLAAGDAPRTVWLRGTRM